MKDMEEVYLNGKKTSLQGRAKHSNVSFNYVEGESLIMALKTWRFPPGSACTSASLEPSRAARVRA